MADTPRIEIRMGDDDSDDEKVQETNLDDLEDDENANEMTKLKKEDNNNCNSIESFDKLNGGDDIEAGSQEDDEDDEEVDRAAWGGKLEFIFTCIGYAVGLGNVWRFPYLCYKNGGGAFLIPYMIMLGLVGLPLFYMELAFGQFASLGPLTIWKINPLLKGLGYAMVAVSWMVCIYYNVIISHVMLYLFASFAAIPTKLPWIDCQNWWNTPRCIEPDYMKTNVTVNTTLYEDVTEASYHFLDNIQTTWSGELIEEAADTANLSHRTPAEEYYYNFVLEISDGIEHANGVNWKLALCLLLAWIIVLICLIRGISSLGKVVYFTAIFPYIMLTILLIRGVTLPGAGQGILFYLKPDFKRLADPRVWSDAATQIFYSLGACCGGLIAMSSYNKFDNNCLQDALIVAVINCATSVYGGFAIFSILGFMAQEKGVPVSEVAQGGPGLAFVVYPEALSRMPAPQLWAIFFFFMMATLGFGSQFSMVECVLSAFADEFKSISTNKARSIAFRVVMIIFTFFMGLPMVTRGGIYLLDLVDYSVSGFPLLFIGLLECACITYFYGYERFADDIELMLGKRPNIYWRITWMGVTPLVIIIVILSNCILYKEPMYGEDYHYPPWALGLGWLIGMFPIILIVVFFIWRYCKDGGWVLLQEIGKPKIVWGPLQKTNRKGTVYQTTLLGTSDLTWKFDPVTQTFVFPDIQLSRTPAGSMFNLNKIGQPIGGASANIAQVQNYTGPIPMVLAMPGSKNAGDAYRNALGVSPLTRLPTSRSMTDLALLGIQNTRVTSRSIGDINKIGKSPIGGGGDKSPGRFGSFAKNLGSSMTNLSSTLAGKLTPRKTSKSPLADEADTVSPPTINIQSGSNNPLDPFDRTVEL